MVAELTASATPAAPKMKVDPAQVIELPSSAVEKALPPPSRPPPVTAVPFAASANTSSAAARVTGVGPLGAAAVMVYSPVLTGLVV